MESIIEQNTMVNFQSLPQIDQNGQRNIFFTIRTKRVSEVFLGLSDIQNQIWSKFNNVSDITLKVEFWLKNQGDFFFNGTLRKFYFFSKLSFSSFVFCFHYVAMAYTKPGRTLWSISEAFLGLNDIQNQILSKFKNVSDITLKVEFCLKT